MSLAKVTFIKSVKVRRYELCGCVAACSSNFNISFKIAATCFGLRPSSGSLHMSLAKVTFIKSVKVRRYELCGCVAACYMKPMVVCVLRAVRSESVLCTVQSETHSVQHTAHTPPWA